MAETRSTICCGEGGAWSHAGAPLLPGCILCSRSQTYWRANRADGRPYVPPTLDELYAVALGEPDASPRTDSQ